MKDTLIWIGGMALTAVVVVVVLLVLRGGLSSIPQPLIYIGVLIGASTIVGVIVVALTNPEDYPGQFERLDDDDDYYDHNGI